ncbi:putative reverse transcriptase domain-containing protein, partial [Tanacetum coccineum]
GKINAECYRGRHRQERDDVQHFEDWIRENIMPPRKAPRTRTTPATTTNTTSVTNAQLHAIIDQGVTAALAARDANRNDDDSHTSGTGVRRTVRVARECTYQDFMKYQPLYFKGTKGVVELTQWFERMEIVFHISHCSVENQIKFSTCTLFAGALTWWNSHVRIVGHDVAYAMTWTELKKKMTDKYCPWNEMKKLEAELWNLKLKESDKVERCKLHHNGPCIVKCGNCKKVGHMNRDCKNPVAARNQRNLTCYECGNQGHYRSDCPELKNQNHGNQAEGTKARGMVYAVGGGETDQDLNNIEYEIEA